MSDALPTMTRETFLAWAEQQDPGYEFDGSKPVLMPPGTVNHGRIRTNLICALHDRFSGGEWTCYVLGVGLATTGGAVRYPDVMISRAEIPGDARLIWDVIAVFEVLSPEPSHVDCILKTREYRTVPTIIRYVIVESSSRGLTVLLRNTGQDDWTAATLTDDEVLNLPEVGVSVPVVELYGNVDFLKTGADATVRG